MYVCSAADSSFAIVADYRFKSDADLDETEKRLGTHVLDFYSTAKSALGAARFQRAHRIALFDYGETPGVEDRRLAREQLRDYLLTHHIKVACVLPTPDIDDEGENQKAETIAWQSFGAPDSLAEMRGTFFHWSDDTLIMPMFPTSPWLKDLQIFQQKDWLRRGWDVACGKSEVIQCPKKILTPNLEMVDALESMLDRPVAVDIENIEVSNTITAIGLSDGRLSVSVPWGAYWPYRHDELMPGLLDGTYTFGTDVARALRRVLSSSQAKIFHNYTFDIPRLQNHGFKINGPIHDTFAAHGTAYPELRHGLQHACASLLNIHPWKSLYHPKVPGITRDDIEYWIADPFALMDYNADDAWHTWMLAQKIMPMVEVDIFK